MATKSPIIRASSNGSVSSWGPPKLRPIRIKCDRLRIGDWLQERPTEDKSSFEAKFLFSRKKFLWEWKCDRVGGKRKIEIPFSIIDAMCRVLGCIDGQMTSSSTAKFWFRMNTAPNIFVGAQMPNHQPRWQAAPDFTKGNVESCAVHELELSIDATGFHSLIKNISEYSPGFRKMLSEKLDRKMLSRNGTGRSFPSATKPHPGSKSSSEPGTDGDALTAAERNKARKRKRTITSSGAGVPSSQLNRSSSRCSCIGSCGHACPCIRELQPCSAERCGCEQCTNPLNSVAKSGVSMKALRSNQCLLDNCQVPGIWNTIRTPVSLPCCGYNVNLMQALASGFRCSCGVYWDYSFCTRRLVRVASSGSDGAAVTSSTHCKICHRCQPAGSFHCIACSKCSTPANPCACVVTKKTNFSRSSSKKQKGQEGSKSVVVPGAGISNSSMFPSLPNARAKHSSNAKSNGAAASTSGMNAVPGSTAAAGSSLSSMLAASETASTTHTATHAAPPRAASPTGVSLTDLSTFSLACLGLTEAPRFVKFSLLNSADET